MSKKYFQLFLIVILGVSFPLHEISHDHLHDEVEVISCHVCESENSTNSFISKNIFKNPVACVVNNLLRQLTYDNILRDSLSRAPPRKINF